MSNYSLTQFEQELMTFSRCQPVGFTAIVKPSRIRASNNPLKGLIRKVTVGSGMINCIYEAGVNRNRLKEGLPADFKAGPPSVGNRMKGTPLLAHAAANGSVTWYLEIFLQRSRSYYFRSDTREELSYFDHVRPLEYTSPRRETFRESQGTKRLIRPLPYKLASIAELRIEGKEWHIEPLIHELRSYKLELDSDDASANADGNLESADPRKAEAVVR